MPRIVIVGGGISGLALAYRLQQALPAADITLLERRSRPGGTIWTEERDGFRYEIGPNGFLDSKATTVSLCRDLGLAEQLIHADEAACRNRFLFLDGKLQALPGSVLAFVRSPLLSWRGKLAFLMERLRRSRAPVREESIDAFARRRAGREAAEIFADALVTGIHAGDPALLSMGAAFPRLVALEKEYGSVIKGLDRSARQRRREAAAQGKPYQRPGRMWAFRRGLRVLIEELASKLRKPPVLGVSVRRLARALTDHAWLVHGEGHDHWSAEIVVLAAPAFEQATLLADLDAVLAEHIAGIAYNRVAVLALGYRKADMPHALNGFGYIAPQRTRRDVLGVQWCSSLFPERAPDGCVLLRAMCGGWNRADMLDWPDDRLLAAVRDELRAAMDISAAPVFHSIIRWDRAIPQYHLGHLEKVAAIEQRAAAHPGLFLTGNAYHGVAMNDCTEQAELLAARIALFAGARRA
jgi:oxygen-dependent protoporphyrinogen oxidase